MKRLFVLFVAASCPAFNAVSTTGPAIDAHPGPPSGWEFYWDDGVVSSGWVWWTGGGNYWAVQFDEVKTGGASGSVNEYGAVTYPDWPDSTFQGCNMHTFEDLGGYPGADLGHNFLQFTESGVYQWVDVEPGIYVTTGVFYIAFQQIGNYPTCDSVAVDAQSGTHNWTGYQGSWSPTSVFGDFMVRCNWGDNYDYTPPEVVDREPEGGDVGVPVDTTIVFHVFDDISGVDIATIEFTVEDASRGPKRVNLAFSTDGPSPTGIISGELVIDDSVIWDVVCTFTPDSDLPYGQTITCTVPGTLADRAGNEMGDDEVWSFETQDEPRVTDTTWGRVKALY